MMFYTSYDVHLSHSAYTILLCSICSIFISMWRVLYFIKKTRCKRKYNFRRDQKSSRFRILARNKWICRETCDFFCWLIFLIYDFFPVCWSKVNFKFQVRPIHLGEIDWCSTNCEFKEIHLKFPGDAYKTVWTFLFLSFFFVNIQQWGCQEVSYQSMSTNLHSANYIKDYNGL